MKTAFEYAISLIIGLDPELLNILGTTLRMSIAGSVISLLLGVPIGILLGSGRFPGRTALFVFNRTLMAMPPVVCGLIFYVLFSGVGPFRSLRLMYSVKLMVLAQIALITPVIAGTMESYASSVSAPVLETAKGLNLGCFRRFLLLTGECSYQMIFAFLLGFSRSIAEVGAVSMVGGAIAWKTNVMTTSIMEYTNKGDLPRAMGLGIILLTLALIVNIVAHLVERKLKNEK